MNDKRSDAQNKLLHTRLRTWTEGIIGLLPVRHHARTGKVLPPTKAKKAEVEAETKMLVKCFACHWSMTTPKSDPYWCDLTNVILDGDIFPQGGTRNLDRHQMTVFIMVMEQTLCELYPAAYVPMIGDETFYDETCFTFLSRDVRVRVRPAGDDLWRVSATVDGCEVSGPAPVPPAGIHKAWDGLIKAIKAMIEDGVDIGAAYPEK